MFLDRDKVEDREASHSVQPPEYMLEDFLDTSLIVYTMIVGHLPYEYVNWAIKFTGSDMEDVHKGVVASPKHIKVLNKAAIKWNEIKGKE